MSNPLLDRILPRGPARLRRLALAELLGPPPSTVRRRKEQRARQAEDRGAPKPAPPGPTQEP